MLQTKPSLKFMIPWVFATLVFLMIYFSGPSCYNRLALVASVNFLDVISGEITAILVGINSGLNPLVVTSFIIFIESDISLIVALNFDILKKPPKMGKRLITYEKKIKNLIEKKSWLKTAAFFGVILITAVPSYGTGALPATIIGRLLGLGWKKSWLAVTIGAAARSVLISLIIYFGYIVLA